jgi:hypothetical protein
MILDKETMFADNLDAVTGTSEVVDLGSVRPGPGKPVVVFVSGSEDIAGVDGFTIADSSDGTNFNTALDISCELDGKLVQVTLPSDVEKFVKVTLKGTPTAGTFTSGIVLDAQTAM